MQQDATECNRLQQDATGCIRLQQDATGCSRLQQAAAGCNRLQQDATGCNRMHQDASGCIRMHQDATRWNSPGPGVWVWGGDTHLGQLLQQAQHRCHHHVSVTHPGQCRHKVAASVRRLRHPFHHKRAGPEPAHRPDGGGASDVDSGDEEAQPHGETGEATWRNRHLKRPWRNRHLKRPCMYKRRGAAARRPSSPLRRARPGRCARRRAGRRGTRRSKPQRPCVARRG